MQGRGRRDQATHFGRHAAEPSPQAAAYFLARVNEKNGWAHWRYPSMAFERWWLSVSRRSRLAPLAARGERLGENYIEN